MHGMILATKPSIMQYKRRFALHAGSTWKISLLPTSDDDTLGANKRFWGLFKHLKTAL